MNNPQQSPAKCHREGPAYSAAKAASRLKNKHSGGKIPIEKATPASLWLGVQLLLEAH